jgi:chemotaxis signal transduction protein
MNRPAPGTMETVKSMRDAFDHGFAVPLHAQTQDWQDFLLIRLGPLPHAVAMSEIQGLQRTDHITHLPGPLPALLGISGHKGRILPTYDLAALLTLPPVQRPLWQLVTRAPSVILAIDDFDRHVRCPSHAIARQSITEHAVQGHIHAHLHTDEGRWPIVSVAAVLRSIQNMANKTAQPER